MPTITTIIPIFAIIAMGAFARRRGFIPETFLGPANRLVYYLAIPALVFRAISSASLQTEFNLAITLINLACILAVAVVVFVSACVIRIPARSREGAG